MSQDRVSHKTNLPVPLHEWLKDMKSLQFSSSINAQIVRCIMVARRLWGWSQEGRRFYVEDEEGELESVILI